MKYRAMEKFQFPFLRSFALALTKFSFERKDCALGYNSMKFRGFPDFSQFPKILSLKSMGNSWGNSYISCLLLIILICFTCAEKKIWWNIKNSQNIMVRIVVQWRHFSFKIAKISNSERGDAKCEIAN